MLHATWALSWLYVVWILELVVSLCVVWFLDRFYHALLPVAHGFSHPSSVPERKEVDRDVIAPFFIVFKTLSLSLFGNRVPTFSLFLLLCLLFFPLFFSM
eukprot:Rmarinus@m.17155